MKIMRTKLWTVLVVSCIAFSCGHEDKSQAPSNDSSLSYRSDLNRVVSLNVPYHCQLDNRMEPYATCSNSSLAMVLKYKGVSKLGYSGNLSDQLYYKFGKLNSAAKIANAARRLGFKTTMRVPSSFSQIISDLRRGIPVIAGGDFVGRAGHYVVIKGLTHKGFIVHDPYGHWDEYTISPYDGYGKYTCKNGYTGKERTYSFAAMGKAAGQGFWTVSLGERL